MSLIELAKTLNLKAIAIRMKQIQNLDLYMTHFINQNSIIRMHYNGRRIEDV